MSSLKSIVLVGSNPSRVSPDNSAFHSSTKSRKFIDSIFANHDYEISYINLIDYKTPNNRPISRSEIRSNLDKIKQKFDGILNKKIIALGKTASDGLTLAEIKHFALPHPSGLCRFWNDKAESEGKIREMFEWILN